MSRYNLMKRWRPAPFFGALLLLLAACLAHAAAPSPARGGDSLAIWQPLASGTEAQLQALWGTSSSDVFAVGSGGTVLHYDGRSWTGMASGTTETLNGVWGASASDVFTVGDNGTIRRYGAGAWQPMSSGTDWDLHGVWGSSPSDVFAVGDNGTILHYDGAAWSIMGSASNLVLYSVCGTSPSDVFAVGVDRYVACLAVVDPWLPCPSQATTALHYDGSDWSERFAGAGGCELTGVWATAPSDVIAVGPLCGAISRYNGQRWAEEPLPTSLSGARLNGVWGRSPSDVYAVGSGGNLHWDGRAWNAWSAGRDLYGIWGSPAGDVFACGEAGTILHSRPPAIRQVSAAQANQGQSASIAIAGANLDGTSAVSFGDGICVEGFAIDGPGQVTAAIAISELAGPGPRDVSVESPGGSATLHSGFTVNPAPPVLLSVDFTQARRGERVWFTAIGRYLAEASSLDFGEGITMDELEVETPNQMTGSCTISPEAAPGRRDATVVTPGGSGTLTEAFEVVATRDGLAPWAWGAIVGGVALLAGVPAAAFLAARAGRRRRGPGAPFND